MEEIFLDVQPRQDLGRGKVQDLRDKGFIPAVVYKEGKVSQAITVAHRQLLQLLHQHRLEGTIINLRLEADKKQKGRPCLIKEVQYDPVLGHIIHVDFHEISLTKVIKINVPVASKGEPIGVKQEGGSLEHILWEIEVECLPTDIPKQIEVDVSNLKMGDTIHVRDLPIPPNIKVLSDPAITVMQVVAPMKEEVVAPAAEGEAPLEPEVIREKKEVAEEGAEGKEGKEGKEKEKEKKEEKKEK